MKFVKRSLSLPPDLNKYVETRARRTARQRGARQNFSAVVAELVMAAKQNEEPKQAA